MALKTWANTGEVIYGDDLDGNFAGLAAGTEITSGAITTAKIADANVTLAKVASEAWTAYTPTWTGSGANPSLGDGTLTARYVKIGRTVHVRFNLTFGASTTEGSGTWSFTLPVTAASVIAYQPSGSAHIEDAGTRGYISIFTLDSTTSFRVEYLNSASSNLGLAGSASPMTWANGDYLRGYFTYEAAA